MDWVGRSAPGTPMSSANRTLAHEAEQQLGHRGAAGRISRILARALRVMGGPSRTRCGRGPSWCWTATCIEWSTATDGSRGSAPVFRGRSDLVVEWPRAGHSLASRPRKHVGERKVAGEKSGLENTIRKGLERAARHMDSCSAVSKHPVVLDLGPDKSRGSPWFEVTSSPGLRRW